MTTPARALADAEPRPYWLDNPDRPAARPPLDEHLTTDLVVVGGGFTGLWTALLAKERDPDRDVVLVESERIGWAASGRNGGFCVHSLTHGEENGRSRYPDELDTLERLGHENLAEIEETIRRYGIECDFHSPGALTVATEPHHVEQLKELALGADEVYLDQDAVRAELASPTYLAGVWNRRGTALVDPAALAWGLARAAESLGVRIVESTAVTGLKETAAGVVLTTSTGRTLTARRVALGTNAFPALLRRLRLYTVPVYDYVLMTEPLTDEQLVSIGWGNRQGLEDMTNQFHYYRMTSDNRILWGGYDAIYYFGRKVRRRYDDRPATHQLLAEQFFATFPQLAGVRFTHKWGGAIDTCTRFFAFYGHAMSGKVAYALGYTGLGVGATRFGANVMLDLLSGEETERTRLRSVREKPLPFPPEPFAYAGIQVTRAAIAQADRNQGRRNLWLRTLDKMGLGFDS